MLLRYYQINQSVIVSQSFCSHQMPDFSAKVHQIQFRLGLHPEHPWGLGAYSVTPADEGGWLTLPRTPLPLSALRASILVLSGAKLLEPSKINWSSSPMITDSRSPADIFRDSWTDRLGPHFFDSAH